MVSKVCYILFIDLIMSLVHHIYVIGNEEHEPERIAYLKDYFQKEGITNVSYFQPSWKTNLTKKEKELFIDYMPQHGRNLRASEKSLFLNFQYAFQDAVQRYSDGYILFLESDVLFEGSLSGYLEALGIFLNSRAPDGICIGSGCDLIADNVNTEDMSFQIYPKRIVRCTDSLLFSVSGLCDILSYMKSGNYNEPIDNYLNDFLKKTEEFSFYWVWPSITRQGSQNGTYKTSIQENS